MFARYGGPSLLCSLRRGGLGSTQWGNSLYGWRNKRSSRAQHVAAAIPKSRIVFLGTPEVRTACSCTFRALCTLLLLKTFCADATPSTGCSFCTEDTHWSQPWSRCFLRGVSWAVARTRHWPPFQAVSGWKA